MILFHYSGYRCLKHFYLEKVCHYLCHLFPEVVLYNRFVELQKEVVIPLALFIKKVLLVKCTGISFVDSTPLRVCRNSVCCGMQDKPVFQGLYPTGTRPCFFDLAYLAVIPLNSVCGVYKLTDGRSIPEVFGQFIPVFLLPQNSYYVECILYNILIHNVT